MNTAKFLTLDVAVRYWEDALLDGAPDEDGNIPFRQGSRWKPTINLDTGEIIGWPKVLAKIHYKVCDDGVYTLTDSNYNKLAILDSYVPEFLAIDDTGFGDYIIMTVDQSGFILNWKRPDIDMEYWETIIDPPSNSDILKQDLDYLLDILVLLTKEYLDLDDIKRLVISRFPDHPAVKLFDD